MARLHNLRARRLKLGVSQYLVGCVAGWRPTGAQSMVSYIERNEATAAPSKVHKVRAALVWLESEPHQQREAARVEAATVARIEAILAAPAAQGRDETLVERLVDLLHDGRSEDFDALAARLEPALVEEAGERYLAESKPSIPEAA